jgi:hypothetical protein
MSDLPKGWKLNRDRTMIATHLSNALQEIEKMMEEFTSNGESR